MRISDWSSDVCSSDLDFTDSGGNWRHHTPDPQPRCRGFAQCGANRSNGGQHGTQEIPARLVGGHRRRIAQRPDYRARRLAVAARLCKAEIAGPIPARSEEHTSELQSVMRISYAVFCLKKKKHKQRTRYK